MDSFIVSTFVIVILIMISCLVNWAMKPCKHCRMCFMNTVSKDERDIVFFVTDNTNRLEYAVRKLSRLWRLPGYNFEKILLVTDNCSDEMLKICDLLCRDYDCIQIIDIKCFTENY